MIVGYGGIKKVPAGKLVGGIRKVPAGKLVEGNHKRTGR